MRILFCNYEYPPLGGGGAVVNASLAQELAKKHKVTVLTSGGLGLPSNSIESGVQIIRVPVFFRKQKAVANLLSMLSYMYMAVRVGKKLLKGEQYDVISTIFVLPTGPVGNALSHFAGIPNVLTVIGGDIYDPSKFTSPHRHLLLRAWVRRLIHRADRIVGNSSNVLNYMRRFYTPEVQGIRIPLGIKRPEVNSASRQEYGFKEDEVLMITVGRLVARKAITQLISVMEAFKGENVRLLIIGTGPQEQILKEEVRRKQLEKQIHFMGYVEDAEKQRILKMCDLYTSTSQHEGFGLVFVEGMAAGLPVVCYHHGGQTDYLQDGVTGYLAPLNDLDCFRKHCWDLIQDKSKRQKMGQENLRRAEKLFIDSCAQRYEKVFQEAIENPGASYQTFSRRDIERFIAEPL